jgi:hypothetical protein
MRYVFSDLPPSLRSGDLADEMSKGVSDARHSKPDRIRWNGLVRVRPPWRIELWWRFSA